MPIQETHELKKGVIRVWCQLLAEGKMQVSIEVCQDDGIPVINSQEVVDRDCCAEFDVDHLTVTVTVDS